MTPTRVETKLYPRTGQIMGTSTSKQWDTSLFSKITVAFVYYERSEDIHKALISSVACRRIMYNSDVLFS